MGQGSEHTADILLVNFQDIAGNVPEGDETGEVGETLVQKTSEAGGSVWKGRRPSEKEGEWYKNTAATQSCSETCGRYEREGDAVRHSVESLAR